MGTSKISFLSYGIMVGDWIFYIPRQNVYRYKKVDCIYGNIHNYKSYYNNNFFYTYTGAFGIQNLVLDIFSLILGVFIGQLIGLKYYENYKYNKVVFYSSLFICLLGVVLFTYFTFNPPNIPLFVDSTTGLRGIYLY